MILFILFMFPPVISTWIFNHLRKKDQPPLFIFYIYSMFVILINIACFFAIIIRGRGGWDFVLIPENISVSFALKYSILSSCFSVSAPFVLHYFPRFLNCCLLLCRGITKALDLLLKRISINILTMSSSGKKWSVLKIIITIISDIVFIFSVLLIFVNAFLVKNWNTLDMAEILFHLSVPLKGVSSQMLELFIRECILPSVLITGIFNLFMFFNTRKGIFFIIKTVRKQLSILLFPFGKYLKFLLPFMAAFLLIWSLTITGKNFDYMTVIKQLLNPSAFIEENYVDPKMAEINFPENKKNLIYIIVESLENTYLSDELGGGQKENYIPEITQLLGKNVSFSNNDLFGGSRIPPSGWTVASIISQFAGIPLKVTTANQSGRNGVFLPNAYSLGQILEGNGYSNIFMQGSDASFSGKDIFLKSHGNYEIMDYIYAKKNNIIPEDYYVFWGFEDKILYSWAKDELLRLWNEGISPFNLTLLTVDTHHIGGYICDLCKNEYSQQYSNVIACMSRQLNDFVSWIEKQEFFKDTVIVITGDHPSMDPDYFYYLGKNYDRCALNIFINSAVKPQNTKNRNFSLMDLFPTTLTALGAEIPGNRLGLGVNLFSDEPSLMEIYGVDTVVSELKKLSKFYNRTFWLTSTANQ